MILMIQCIYIPLTDSPHQKKSPQNDIVAFWSMTTNVIVHMYVIEKLKEKKSKVTHLGQDRTKNDFSKIYSAFYENMVSKAISL